MNDTIESKAIAVFANYICPVNNLSIWVDNTKTELGHTKDYPVIEVKNCPSCGQTHLLRAL